MSGETRALQLLPRLVGRHLFDVQREAHDLRLVVGHHLLHARQTAELALDAALSARSEDRLVQDGQLDLFYRWHVSNLTPMTPRPTHSNVIRGRLGTS